LSKLWAGIELYEPLVKMTEADFDDIAGKLKEI
jgi:hypothetical protein